MNCLVRFYICMQDTSVRVRTRPMQPLGQARASIGYLTYKFYIVTQSKLGKTSPVIQNDIVAVHMNASLSLRTVQRFVCNIPLLSHALGLSSR